MNRYIVYTNGDQYHIDAEAVVIVERVLIFYVNNDDMVAAFDDNRWDHFIYQGPTP